MRARRAAKERRRRTAANDTAIALLMGKPRWEMDPLRRDVLATTLLLVRPFKYRHRIVEGLRQGHLKVHGPLIAELVRHTPFPLDYEIFTSVACALDRQSFVAIFRRLWTADQTFSYIGGGAAAAVLEAFLSWHPRDARALRVPILACLRTIPTEPGKSAHATALRGLRMAGWLGDLSRRDRTILEAAGGSTDAALRRAAHLGLRRLRGTASNEDRPEWAARLPADRQELKSPTGLLRSYLSVTRPRSLIRDLLATTLLLVADDDLAAELRRGFGPIKNRFVIDQAIGEQVFHQVRRDLISDPLLEPLFCETPSVLASIVTHRFRQSSRTPAARARLAYLMKQTIWRTPSAATLLRREVLECVSVDPRKDEEGPNHDTALFGLEMLGWLDEPGSRGRRIFRERLASENDLVRLVAFNGCYNRWLRRAQTLPRAFLAFLLADDLIARLRQAQRSDSDDTVRSVAFYTLKLVPHARRVLAGRA